jgi:lysyl-tRNA synthetase, class II
MADKMNDLQKQRLDKLEKLKSLQINPYPQPNLKDKQSIAEAKEMLDKTVTVAGRVMSKRGQGKISFADLHDRTGKIQLFFEFTVLGEEKMNLSKLLDLGDIISATGVVFKTQAGEITIKVSSFQILTKNMKALPEKWHGLQDVEERYRQRYVDLIVNPEVKEVFLTRTKILTLMRRFLDDNGFIEVETPILQPVYGGASAKPFTTHHNFLDTDMYLRISDELYLKRLIVGGFEKVYEVSRDFRNEGVSRFHNPEFTQIEFYWAYVDYEVLMDFTEKLIEYVLQNVKGSTKITFQGTDLDFSPPIKKLTFSDAIFEKTQINIDEINSEEQFHQILKDKNLKLDLTGVVGLGALFDALYKEYVRPDLIQPTFITDYPASMIALAKRKEDNPDKIASFQLVACGAEMLKAYNELNDPKDQLDRWTEEETLAKKGAENTMQIDTDYIRALEYGMPPTAGWGMGIDRFAQFVTDQSTIKDVILFPAMKPEGNQNKKIIIEEPKKEIIKPKNSDIKKSAEFKYDRQQYLDAVKKTLEQNIFYHSLALEACMGGIYDYLKENNQLDENELTKKEWMLAGLIHDIDYSGDTKESHPLKIKEVLSKFNLEIPEEINQIILAHDGRQNSVYDNKAKWAIFCADSLTGLMVATALVYPSKKLADVKTSSVLKRFLKEPKFAAGTRRDEVKMCESPDGLNILLEKFIEICLTSMQSIASEIGL